MKKMIIATALSICLLQLYAQPIKHSFTSLSTIGITTTKTTNLVFSEPIVYVDRGAPEVLVAQVKEAGNILLVKAAKLNFQPTNLSVITGEGKLYNIGVHYEGFPKQLVYQFTDSIADATVAIRHKSNPQILPTVLIRTYANNILYYKRVMHGVTCKVNSVVATLNGIYYKDDVLFFQIAVKNRTPLNYDLAGTSIYIKDRKRLKRTATQEQEVPPLFTIGDQGPIPSGKQQVMVIALNALIPSAGKYLTIEIMEKQGTGSLLLKVPPQKVLQAKLLADLP